MVVGGVNMKLYRGFIALLYLISVVLIIMSFFNTKFSVYGYLALIFASILSLVYKCYIRRKTK